MLYYPLTERDYIEVEATLKKALNGLTLIGSRPKCCTKKPSNSAVFWTLDNQ